MKKDTVRVTLDFPVEIHTEFKVKSAQLRMKLKDYMIQLMQKGMDKENSEKKGK